VIRGIGREGSLPKRRPPGNGKRGADRRSVLMRITSHGILAAATPTGVGVPAAGRGDSPVVERLRLG
jgi:hypothetical protein